MFLHPNPKPHLLAVNPPIHYPALYCSTATTAKTKKKRKKWAAGAPNKAGRWNLIGWVELEDGDWPMGVGPGVVSTTQA